MGNLVKRFVLVSHLLKDACIIYYFDFVYYLKREGTLMPRMDGGVVRKPNPANITHGYGARL